MLQRRCQNPEMKYTLYVAIYRKDLGNYLLNWDTLKLYWYNLCELSPTKLRSGIEIKGQLNLGMKFEKNFD